MSSAGGEQNGEQRVLLRVNVWTAIRPRFSKGTPPPVLLAKLFRPIIFELPSFQGSRHRVKANDGLF